MPRTKEPPEPWRSFFADVDSLLSEDVQLHCCGGFVATQLYGIARTTSDIDFLDVVPNVRNGLIEIGGKGSALHQRHKVYLDAVTVATPPENFAGHLKADVLRERYYAELRPNPLAYEARHDLTLRLWLESYWPV